MNPAGVSSPPPSSAAADAAGAGGRAARPRRAHGRGGHRERLHAAQLRRPEDRRRASAGSTTPSTRSPSGSTSRSSGSSSSWDTMIQAVREGQFDVGMDGITITDERKEQVDFSDPYMVSEQFMLVRADENRFTDAKTLRRQQGPPDRRPGRHDQLLHRRLQRARRRREEPAHQALRHLRRLGAGAEVRRRRLVLMDKTSAAGYMGASPNCLQDRRRSARHRGVRLHLQAGLRPRRADQRRDPVDEGRRHDRQAEQEVVLRLPSQASERRREAPSAAESRRRRSRRREYSVLAARRPSSSRLLLPLADRRRRQLPDHLRRAPPGHARQRSG